jgi:geranylgeranyl pyrophosphate synthase
LYLKALGLDIDDAQIVYQSAIELVHNASLIHDDVIDESDTRRGKNSLNKDLGNKLAVISGDFLLSKALEKIISINSIELVDLFCQTLKNMTLGEINQYKLRYEIPDLEDYLKKTEYKTADLFILSLKGSLKIAKVQENCDFAKNFGMAFQIRDDLINAKTSKTDFEGGIYTAPVIFSGGVEISQIGLEKTRDLLNNYIEKAEKSIEFMKESVYKEALLNLVRGLQNE